MNKPRHIQATDIRGISRLAIDATIGLTRLVETMHHNISRTPGPVGTFTQEPTQGITGLVYRSIQGTTRLVGSGIDALLGQLTPLLEREPKSSSRPREAVVAALNGVLGDHLAASANPLAIQMQLRRDGKPLVLTAPDLAASFPAAGGKLLILLHGLCMNDLQWQRKGHDHGAALAAAAGYTPLYLRYNSGLHVSSNGQAFADMLEALLENWPVPIEKLVILGHSMGGLVARSACHYGQAAGHAWLKHLRQMVFLGTPHHGAPLERGGNWVDVILEVSPYTAALARLGKIRSAGITDLRHGSILEADWKQGDRFARKRKVKPVPLPEHVECYAMGVTLAKAPGKLGTKLLGDGLVPLSSALGQHTEKRRRLEFAASHQWTGYGLNHLDLLNNAEVFEQMRSWLDE
ncbi:MAG: GPI inositol-deacylase [Burkholderiaceae bacterium]|nr:GPI inositol-deacylase [Sulfuritalea sp.]MCF8175879.1 GPI inositol-deacylase [Burkholderiaceae bacterium]